jgi:hypothetical protein
MSKKYIEVKAIEGLTKKQVAQELSAKLWNLQRPNSIKNPKDITKYLFGVTPHPILADDWVVEVDGNYEIKKHQMALEKELVDFAESLSSSEKTTLSNLVKNNSTITVNDIISNLRQQIISYPL